jgi:serine/threonine protein phosphatase PrpC
MSLSSNPISIPTDYSLGHFISDDLWSETKQTLDLMTEIAEHIEEVDPTPHRAVKLYSIVQEILGSNNLSELESTLSCQLKEIKAIGNGIVPADEKAQWMQIKSKIASLLEKSTREPPLNKSIFQFAKKKSPPKRIWEHNRKAKEAQRLLERIKMEFEGFPSTHKEKEDLRARRDLISSMSDFKENPKELPLNRVQILSETVQVRSSSVEISCTIGQRAKMEDRSIATRFSFQANGEVFEAELFGVLDGHGGISTVEYVKDSIAKRVQERLEDYLQDEAPNEEGIFYALKEALSSLHDDIKEAAKFKDGTTAVIGFKLADSDELWVANIGDSRAFLNRKGKLIPMSIDQKPYYIEETWKEKVRYNNEYLNQLIRMGVEESIDPSEELEDLRKKLGMVYSRQYTENNLHHVLLGLPQHNLDMTRSIGDISFDPWKKHSPEIFRQKLLPGDQLIMHSDGIKDDMSAIVDVVENDKRNGFSTKQTVEDLVHASLYSEDNITAMIVSFVQ